ncbi:MAG: hypothetical protein IJA69_04030 [Clostridia bacterium]|nr:hypothetical protein [Clostridia bacterium]
MEEKNWDLNKQIKKDLREVVKKYKDLKFAFICDNGEMMFMLYDTFFYFINGDKLGTKPENHMLAKLDEYINANYKNPDWEEVKPFTFCGGKSIFD